MTDGPQSTAPNFDLLARAYRWMEYASFGPFLQRCRCHYLPACRSTRRVLVLGDGDGRFTQELLLANSAVHVDAVDASANMLQALQQRAKKVGAAGRVHVILADIRTLMPELDQYDLIFSNFFLDCLTTKELDELVQRLSSNLTPQSRWLIAEFAIPDHGLCRSLARGLVRSLYFAFRLLTGLRVQQLPDYAQIFTQNGFCKQYGHNFLGGILVCELWQSPQRTS